MIAPQQLEQLLLDHALGACPPEVEALLETYLEDHPDTRLQLDGWRSIADPARTTLADPPRPLPPFPRRKLQTAQNRRHFLRMSALCSGLAACLVIGAFAGHFWPERRVSTPVSAVIHVPTPDTQTAPHVAAVQDFWSISRLREYARQTSVAPIPAVLPDQQKSHLHSFAPFGGSL